MKLLETIPTGYVERFPRRGPWIDVATPPAFDSTNEVMLADGFTTSATYLAPKPGARPLAIWWGWNRTGMAELAVIGWREGGQPHQ